VWILSFSPLNFYRGFVASKSILPRFAARLKISKQNFGLKNIRLEISRRDLFLTSLSVLSTN